MQTDINKMKKVDFVQIGDNWCYMYVPWSFLQCVSMSIVQIM